MTFARSLLLVGSLGFAASSAGCVEMYTASGTCTYCEGEEKRSESVFTPAGTNYCSHGQANVALQEVCRQKNEYGTIYNSPINYQAFDTFDFGQCNGTQRAPISLTPDAARLLNGLLGFSHKPPAAPQSVVVYEGEVCEIPPAITFQITARNQRQEPEYPCRDVRIVRVGYSKWNSVTKTTEDVTLEANVLFGSSHTFTCTDAYARSAAGVPDPQGVADFVYVLFQGFSEQAGSKCTPIPLNQGGMSKSLNGLIKNGGTVDISLLGPGAGNTFSFTITNPDPSVAAQGMTSKHGTPVLTPIPDPKFAAR